MRGSAGSYSGGRLLDVNSAKIKPYMLATIIHAAQFQVGHPKIQVITSGWTAPRRQQTTTLVLGIKGAMLSVLRCLTPKYRPASSKWSATGMSSQVCTTQEPQMLAASQSVVCRETQASGLKDNFPHLPRGPEMRASARSTLVASGRRRPVHARRYV
jgi:hypothetical protein